MKQDVQKRINDLRHDRNMSLISAGASFVCAQVLLLWPGVLKDENELIQMLAYVPAFYVLARSVKDWENVYFKSREMYKVKKNQKQK